MPLSIFCLVVQEKDYPEQYKLVSEFSVGKKRGEVHGKLKEIAAEIEATEGRKVELIKRKIVKGAYMHRTYIHA